MSNHVTCERSVGDAAHTHVNDSDKTFSYASELTEKGGPPGRSPSEIGEIKTCQYQDWVASTRPDHVPMGNSRQIKSPPGLMIVA